MRTKLITLTIILFSVVMHGYTQADTNYDEQLVPAYTLPALLETFDGQPVGNNVGDWESIRRPELLDMFAREMYGRTPATPIDARYEVVAENPAALGGKATSRQVRFIFSNGEKEVEALLLLYLPNLAVDEVPVFVGYNFKGNHSITADTSVLYSPGFLLIRERDHPDWERGVQASRWALEDVIDRGYAIATMCYHDIFPDQPGFKDHSVASLFPGYGTTAAPDTWQAIGAWAWGSSRIVDYLSTEPRVDIAKVALMGHSRQGKAALWAGAQDERFGVVISNNSGEGGAALSRRKFGERLQRVASIQPSWFCPAFAQYHDREEERPIDQHQLLALIAPRAVYVASAEEDLWADPKGEYLAAYHATPVFELYGLVGLPSVDMPQAHQPIMHDIGYHIREGKHDVTAYDWARFLDFADMHFKGR